MLDVGIAARRAGDRKMGMDREFCRRPRSVSAAVEAAAAAAMIRLWQLFDGEQEIDTRVGRAAVPVAKCLCR